MKLSTTEAYSILGVQYGSDASTVKLAYRRLIIRWHPDRCKEHNAKEMTQKINVAFQHLSDINFNPGPASSYREDSRQESHQHYSSAADDNRTYGGFGFKPAPNIKRKVKVTLEEAAFGCIKTFKGKTRHVCRKCDGRGDQDGKTFKCNTCDGSGLIREFGQRYQTCWDCGGHGVFLISCDACDGTGFINAQPYSIRVSTPPGVMDGETRTIPGAGGLGSDGKTRSDILVTFEVKEHPLFYFSEGNKAGVLCLDVPINIFEMLRGAVIAVPTLYGLHQIRLKAGQSRYVVPGKGFPDRKGVSQDFHVFIHTSFIDASSPELADLVVRIEAILESKGSPEIAANKKKRQQMQKYSPAEKGKAK